MGTNNQAGRTRYVFAGTPERKDEPGIKTCPRCGEMLFADMDVCYGCLYDFSKDTVGSRLPDAGRGLPQRKRGSTGGIHGVSNPATPLPKRGDPLESIELDEVDDEPDDTFDGFLGLVPSGPSTKPARHSKRDAPSADDTLDLSAAGATTMISMTPRSFEIAVNSTDVRVSLPLPSQGLSVGRDETNDIVLRSRSVSRSHLKLLPKDNVVLVEDCGATNPALIRGVPLSGTEALSDGEAVMLCGFTIEVHDCGGGAMN